LYSKCSKLWPLALTHARSRVYATDQQLCRSRSGVDGVMAIGHLRHCEILQGEVSSQTGGSVRKYNCYRSKKFHPTNAMCKTY